MTFLQSREVLVWTRQGSIENLQRGTHLQRKGHHKPDALFEHCRDCFKISNSVVRCHCQFPWSNWFNTSSVFARGVRVVVAPFPWSIPLGWWYCHQVANWTLQSSGEGLILDMPVHDVLHLSVVNTWPISSYNSVSSRIYWICAIVCSLLVVFARVGRAIMYQ